MNSENFGFTDSRKLLIAGSPRGYVAIISPTDARHYRHILYPLTVVARVRAANGS